MNMNMNMNALLRHRSLSLWERFGVRAGGAGAGATPNQPENALFLFPVCTVPALHSPAFSIAALLCCAMAGFVNRHDL